MSKTLRSLWRGECFFCHRFTMIRERFLLEQQQTAHVCARCVPVDSNDMTHESHKLVAAGY
jgi:hypothetical protein